MINWAMWFMVWQVVSCLGAAIGFGLFQKDYPLGWVWFCYSLANVGFAMKAIGY